MKKSFLMLAAAMMVLTACEKNNVLNEGTVMNQTDEPTEVTLQFSPYDMTAITRGVTSIAGVVTKLDVWVYQGGSEVAAVHQASTDDGFGSVSVTLDKTKTYTLYAMGHRCSGAATLSDGVVSFPDDKVTHAMFYSQTFTPATTTVLSCLMDRIVGVFCLTTTDAVPEEVTKMSFAMGTSPTRWNVAGYGVNPIERTSTYSSITRKGDGTVSLSVYAIADADEPVDHTITVTAYDSNENVVQTRTFTDVPIRNGYRTTYAGAFFIDAPMSVSFTVDDWTDYEVVNF